MIPKRIFTVWLGDEPSDMIKECLESQKIPGYEHRLITLDNLWTKSRYISEALAAKEKLGVKRWCKIADLLRMYLLFWEGGIYLDGDMEVVEGKNFDDLLDHRMFIGTDEAGNLASSVMGAEAQHPLLSYIISQVEDNFRGDGGWIWEPGMEYFNKIAKSFSQNPQNGIVTLPSDYFFPYHWHEKTMNITPNTRVIHRYLGSWV